TYDHRVWRTGLPVRSAVLKPHAGRLVVGWVTTSESLLLYVFVFFFLLAYKIWMRRISMRKMMRKIECPILSAVPVQIKPKHESPHRSRIY
ncbi:hypothetical protein BO71DRAFT_454952, partial [Aspergillus ellipticus CBS 707.79]